MCRPAGPATWRFANAPWPIATHVWQNDVLTAVMGSVVKGQEVHGNAINNAGTILTSMYQVSNENNTKWVRINALH